MEPLAPWLEGLLPYFQNEAVDEVFVNGNRGVIISSRNVLKWAAAPFWEPGALTRNIQEFSRSQGRRLDPVCPMAGGECHLSSEQLFRWHAVIPPIAADGAVFSLRRQRFTKLSMADFRVDIAVREKLAEAFRERRTLFLFGPTSAGKSSFLMSMLKEWAQDERVFILEKIPELPLLSPFWVRLLEKPESRENRDGVELGQLFQEVLRMRPDRLVLGELRGSEIDCLAQAMNAGHGGVITTLHIFAPELIVSRLEQLSPKMRRGLWQEYFWETNPCLIGMKRGRDCEITFVDDYRSLKKS